MPSSRATSLALAIALSAAGCDRSTWLALWGLSPRQWPPPRAGYVNPIPGENALAGDAHWADGPDAAAREIEGYADRISARGGDTLSVQVSSSAASTATWTLYRLGDYGGAGARNVASGGPVSVSPQPACPMEAGTGLVRCSWPTTFKVYVDTQSVSGLYALKLIRADGKTRFVPLVVTDDRRADLMMQASVQTYEAYNKWGGESLYADAAKTTPHGYGTKVSFDRPFDDDRGLGQMLKWETPMMRFLEHYGYDVTYVTNVDVSVRDASFIGRAGMFLVVGHDEYWAGSERTLVETSRDNGSPLAFFSSNTGYWKIRYEDFRTASNPRTLVCYKAGGDPLGASQSGLFRGTAIGQPENSLMGVMYDSWQVLASPFIAGDATAWLYAGTGMKTGDVISGIVGYEFDHRYENLVEPAVTVLAHSPVATNLGVPNFAETVSYRAASGAQVFAAGSFYWSRGLDHNAAWDPRVERMTANVLQQALGLDIPASLGTTPMLAPAATFGPAQATVSTVATGLEGPAGIAVIPATAAQNAGQIVVASPRTAKVLLVDPVTGSARVLAGDGNTSLGAEYDNVPGLQARFDIPVAVAVDSTGRVYVADAGAHVIRRIDVDPLNTTTTLAGSLGKPGSSDGASADARFSAPEGLSLLQGSSTLYVADTSNHRIRAVDIDSGAVTTIAGSVAGDLDAPGTSARFAYPTGIASAPDGTIFVLSSQSAKLKMILPDTARTVTTLAGGVAGFIDGTGAMARLGPQIGAAWVGSFLAVSDIANLRVRAVVPGANAAATQVTTLAFSGAFGDQDGPASQGQISLPTGLAFFNGVLYVADGASGKIRSIVSAW